MDQAVHHSVDQSVDHAVHMAENNKIRAENVSNKTLMAGPRVHVRKAENDPEQ